ncbi:MAG: hypothetical protein U5N53_09885 [Mycobacterium sp.]|nr:hypothetical protein [Mycobacterium sp.]
MTSDAFWWCAVDAERIKLRYERAYNVIETRAVHCVTTKLRPCCSDLVSPTQNFKSVESICECDLDRKDRADVTEAALSAADAGVRDPAGNTPDQVKISSRQQYRFTPHPVRTDAVVGADIPTPAPD